MTVERKGSPVSTMQERNIKGRLITQALIGAAGIGVAFGIAAVAMSGEGDQSSPEMRNELRVSGLLRVNTAIASYFADHGELPLHQPDPRFGGWETSLDGRFLQVLIDEGYLETALRDPVGNDTFHYRYFVYPASSWGENADPFYVLVISELESSKTHPSDRGGFSRGGRNWGDEFPFVLGGP